MILIGEYISQGKIVGGGKLKKIIIENVSLLPKIDVRTKINKSIIQIRLIKGKEDAIDL